MAQPATNTSSSKRFGDKADPNAKRENSWANTYKQNATGGVLTHDDVLAEFEREERRIQEEAKLSGANTPILGASPSSPSTTPSPTPEIREKLTAVSAQASRIINKLKDASIRLNGLKEQNDEVKEDNRQLKEKTSELERSSTLLAAKLEQSQGDLEKAKLQIAKSSTATLVIEAQTGELQKKIIQYETELAGIFKQTTELNELVDNDTVQQLLIKDGGRRQSSKRRQNNKNHLSKRRQLYKRSFHKKRKSTTTYK